VVMMSGPKSSGKTFTTDCLMGMVGYGVPWCDGTKTKRALAFVVTTEDKPEWDRKHSAWLTLMGKPIIDQDNVKFIEPADESFHRKVETKRHGTVKVDHLDLLDPASVTILISQCQQTMKAEKLGCGILALDNLASLVPGRLDKPQIQLLVRHLHLIANKLNCCVILINHTHLKNPRQYQGLAALGDLIDGTFYVSRDGMRTRVFIERLKGGVADGMTYEFAATVVTLGFKKNGQPITSLAMRLVGLAGQDTAPIDHAAGIRKMVCEKAPDKRLSSSQVIKMLSWDKQSKEKGDGGNQHKALQRAIPTEWTSVAMDNGTAREIRRAVEQNPTRHWIENRVLKPPPKPKGKPVTPDQTPDPTGPDSNVVEFPTPPKPAL
jgi:AAA domain-containing protein